MVSIDKQNILKEATLYVDNKCVGDISYFTIESRRYDLPLSSVERGLAVHVAGRVENRIRGLLTFRYPYNSVTECMAALEESLDRKIVIRTSNKNNVEVRIVLEGLLFNSLRHNYGSGFYEFDALIQKITSNENLYMPRTHSMDVTKIEFYD